MARDSVCLRLLVAILCCALGAASACADPLEFTSLGLTGVPVTGISADYGRLFALTSDGFCRYSATTESWNSFREPGQAGRGVTAINADQWLDVPAVSGRLGTDGHGYLTVEYLDGTTGPTTHVSTGGAVAAIAGDGYWFPVQLDLWAVTRAGPGAGELLHSTDNGLSWTVITGHGMADLTGVAVISRYQQPGEIVVAGDAGVVITTDSGVTWAPYGTDLPAGPIRALGQLGPVVASLPAAKTEYHPWFLALTDQGIHQLHETATAWEPILVEDCQQVEGSVLGLRRAYGLTLTNDGKLLVGVPGSGELPWIWEDWSSAFPGLTVIAACAETGIYVATATQGVFAVPISSPAPLPRPALQVQAAPNPFNATTTVRYELPIAGPLALRVYDTRGHLVRTLVSAERPEGPGRVTWDGRDESGLAVASGVYLVEARTAVSHRIVKVSLVE